MLYPAILQFFVRNNAAELYQKTETYPVVSLIVTVHNEQDRIRDKLENSLALRYPGEFEILIASDGSTDATNQIVLEYFDRQVKLVEVHDHKGKENAQLQGIHQAKGDILVFSDVATVIEPEAMIRLVEYFNDPAIGAVSSEDKFISQDGSIAGEGAYVKYEMWLRRCESRAAGLVGLSGSFFAARKQVCAEWDIFSPSDFNTALNCARQGMLAVTMPDVFGYYHDLSDPSKEYQRKVRTIIRGITAIARNNEVLSFKQFGLFAFQVWSHKILRWAVPWFMLGLLLCSLLTVDAGGIYLLIFCAQILFYAIVLSAYAIKSLRNHVLFKIPFFFVQVNLAIAHAAVMFFSGKRMYTWAPSKR